MSKENGFDYDYIVIGSGFGGSVSALRLSEKGYRVGVIEAGRRFEDKDFAKSSWNIGRFIWAPLLGCRGILRMTPFSDVFIASGAGVGGGSIVYANTLYRASPEYFKNPQWDGLADWEAELAPHFAWAEDKLVTLAVGADLVSAGSVLGTGKDLFAESAGMGPAGIGGLRRAQDPHRSNAGVQGGSHVAVRVAVSVAVRVAAGIAVAITVAIAVSVTVGTAVALVGRVPPVGVVVADVGVAAHRSERRDQGH